MIRYISIFIFLIGTVVNAQFNFLYRQFVLNQMGLNPAYAGSREVFVVANQTRVQWIGIEGAPKTITISADAPLKNKKLALGLYAIHESIGNTSNYNFDINYAYRIQLRLGTISMGLKAATQVFTVHKLENVDFTGETVFNTGDRTYIMPNFGAGIYFYDYNKYFVGVSVPCLLNYVGGSGNNGYKIDNNLNYYNFLGSAGVLIKFTDDFKWRLSSLAEYNLVTSFSFDINNMFLIKDLIWFGGSYHTKGIITIMGQWQVNPQLRIGYAYDYSFGNLKQLSGSHEIMLRYEFSYIIKAVSPIF